MLMVKNTVDFACNFTIVVFTGRYWKIYVLLIGRFVFQIRTEIDRFRVGNFSFKVYPDIGR